MREFSCVLVVDHDTDVRGVISAQIEAIGHLVIACGSAAEARAILAARTVQLLVAYEEIKDELRLGSRDFIGKPFRSGELAEQVNRVLAKPNNALSGDQPRGVPVRLSFAAPTRTIGSPIVEWTIWWDMHRRPGEAHWSRAVETTQAEALDRARRFLRLGFVVYQIRDAKGAVFMDEVQITQHFANAS